MKKFTLEDAKAAEELKIDFNKEGYTVEEFLEGMNIELEHGTVDKETNVTDDDRLVTAKIALRTSTKHRFITTKTSALKPGKKPSKIKGDTKGKNSNRLMR